MICVIATIELAEGHREGFLDQFRKIIPTVLAEDGCIEYAPMIDLPTSVGDHPTARENVVTVVEKWTTVEALEAHLMASHMMEYRRIVKPMVVASLLSILEPA